MSLRRLLYTILLFALLPFVLLRLLIKSRQNPGYRQRIGERLGFVQSTLVRQPVIWVHAVSVGETYAARSLIDSLIRRYPNHQLLITSTTPTGSDTVRRLFGDRVTRVYFPYDLPFAVNRFIRHFSPRMLIIMETEIWPNLFAACNRLKIPVMLANARLSERSTQNYLRVSKLTAETLCRVTCFAVRNEQDADNFRRLGVASETIRVSGNIKYDLQLDQAQIDSGRTKKQRWDQNRPVFLAASTHEGEEQMILSIFKSLRQQLPDLMLVLVPRHPERFDAVFQLIQAEAGWRFFRHSMNPDYSMQPLDGVLGDTMGEMQSWIAASDVVFMGGSLVKIGGHNPLDAIALGVPVVTGPYLYNFEDIYPSLRKAGLCKTGESAEQVTEQLAGFLQNGTGDTFRKKANRYIARHQGVTERLMQIIEPMLMP